MSARSTKRVSKTKSGTRVKKKRIITPEDLLRLQTISDPQISPCGQFILFSKQQTGEKYKRTSSLWLADVDRAKSRRFTTGGKDSHGRWSPGGTSIAFVSDRDESQSKIFTIPASGGEATLLTKFPEGKVGTFRYSPDGTMLAVSFRETEPVQTEAAKKERKEAGQSDPPMVIDNIFYRLDGDGYFNNQRYHLYIVDVDSGVHRLLYDRDTLGFFSFDWSPDSTELVVSSNTRRDAMLKYWMDELYRIDVQTGKARKIPNLPFGYKTSVAWSPDGKTIAYVGRESKEGWGVDNSNLYICSADGGNARDLTGDEDYCLMASTISDTAEVSFDANLCWDRSGKRVFMNFGWRGESHVASIATRGNARMVFHTRGRQVVSMGNFCDNGSRMALAVADQTTPTEIAIGSFSQKGKSESLRVKTLTNFNKPLLDELNLSPAEPHSIETPSGTKVHLWVMKPIGFKQARKYPAILMIHGGPHCQYGETFFHELQVLAAAGYVVVYGNPRGSKGYGENHCRTIKGNWGVDDWEDIQTITHFMQQSQYINSKRIGIAGGSYGGYMTNWAIGHSDDYRAAVTDRCVSNLVSMAGSSDFPLTPGEYWDGNSWDNTEELWNQSPLKYFGNVNTPTLIIHSEGDLRCNVEQSEQIFTALKLRGIATRFVRYPDSTSHGMSRMGPPDLRIHRLKQYLDWWNTYLK